MNQIFSFSRWGMLVTRHWAENRRRFMLSLLAMGGILITWYGFVLIIDRADGLSQSRQIMTYYTGLFFVGCLYGSTVFAELGHKKQALQYIAVPASQLEKLLTALLFGVLLFFAAYTLLFYLVDIPMVKLAEKLPVPYGLRYVQPAKLTGVFNAFHPARDFVMENDGSEMPAFFLIIFLILQSVFILGSVYFNKYSFIKTIVAIVLFLLIITLFMAKVIEETLPGHWHTAGFFGWQQIGEWAGPGNGIPGELMTISLSATTILLRILEFTLPVIFWFITYVRLKEKEA